MIAGFISLYLGLRTSEWWASLVLLGTSATASVARVLLVPDNLELSQPTLPYAVDVCWPFNIWWSKIRPHCQARETIPRIQTLEGPTTAYTVCNPDALVLPAVLGPSYHTLTVHCHYPRIVPGNPMKLDHALAEMNTLNPDSLKIYGALITHGLRAATYLRNNSLMPVELTSSTLNIDKTHSNITRPAQIVFSDIVCSDGVWRQPLEILILRLRGGPIDVGACNKVLLYLSSWLEHALSIRGQVVNRSLATQILKGNFEYVCDQKEFVDTSATTADHPPLYTLFSRSIDSWCEGDNIENAKLYPGVTRDYIWTAAKIFYVLFEDMPAEMIMQSISQFHVQPFQKYLGENDLSLSEQELETLVQFLREGGLVVQEQYKVNATDPDTSTTPHDPEVTPHIHDHKIDVLGAADGRPSLVETDAV